MHRRSLLILSLAVLLTLAPAYGAFLNNDIGSTNVLVTFDQFGTATQLTGSPVLTHNLNGYTVNMSVPTPEGPVEIYYGVTGIGAGFAEPTDPYVLNLADQTNLARKTIEFTLTGNAVSAIGIRISALPGLAYTNVTLEAFANDVSVGVHTFEGAGAPGVLHALSGDPSLGGFYGFEIATPTITRFRISGGPIALDDLRFTSAGAGPDPDPDTSAVPEANTFLLCASVLGLLSFGGRFRLSCGTSGR